MSRESAAPPKPFLIEPPLKDRAPETLTRQEIMAVLPPPNPYFSARVVRISTDLVVKYGTRVQMGEARSMMFAATVPPLHVPHVHDAWVVEQDDLDDEVTDCTYILMDWIHGDCLGEIWQSLDENRRSLILHQIRAAIEALHGKVLDTPGPIGGGRSRGFYFTDDEGVGPFASQREMEQWFDTRLEVCRDYRRAPQDGFSFVDYLHPLVMCHLDVHTHNIVIDSQGSLWFLDWELAGAYPHYFEGLFMCRDQDNPDFTEALEGMLKSSDFVENVARIESIGFAVTTGKNLQPGSNRDPDS